MLGYHIATCHKKISPQTKVFYQVRSAFISNCQLQLMKLEKLIKLENYCNIPDVLCLRPTQRYHQYA